MVYAGKAIVIQTDTEFGTKLNRFVLFATNYRTHIRLANTNNMVVTASGFGLNHVPLLLIQMLNDPVAS